MYLAINTIVQQIMIFHSFSSSPVSGVRQWLKDSVRKNLIIATRNQIWLGYLESLPVLLNHLSCHIGNLNISDSSLLFAMQSRELKEMTILNIQTEATDPSLYHIQLSGGRAGGGGN